MTQFLQFSLLGLGSGSIYALVAFGIVVVYRGSGVLNFASGASGIVGGYLFFDLRPHVGLASAFVIVIAASGAFGALVHFGPMRLLQNRPGLNRLMMTLAILTALESFAGLHWGYNLKTVDAILPSARVEVLHGVFVNSDRLYLLAIAVALGAALTIIYRYTSFGLATAAVSESPRSTEALGHSANTIAAVNWALGVALSSAGAILSAPITGLQPDQAPLFVVPALAAAVIGGFTSFPLVLSGAVAIGIAQSQMSREPSLSYYSEGIPFIIIILILALRGRALPTRGGAVDQPARFGTGRFQVRASVVCVAALLVLMHFMTTTWLDALTLTLIGALVVMSVVIVTGLAGQLSLAQMALSGIGAWAAAELVASSGLSFELALLVALCTSIPVALIVGLPSLRTRGVSLAVATLGLGLVLQNGILNNPARTGGQIGTHIGKARFLGFDVDAIGHPYTYALVVLGFVVVGAFIATNLVRSPSGRRLIAVRSSERASATLGINVAGAKLYAFSLSGVFAALAGVLYAYRSTDVVFNSFSVIASVSVVLYAVVGGTGFVSGALIGGTMVPGGVGQQALTSIFGSSATAWTQFIAGLLTIVILVQMPDGLVHSHIAPVKAWLAARAAERPKTSMAENERPPSDTRTSRVQPRTLTVENVTVRYGGVVAVDGISFVIKPGEVLGLIGPNGAGKTTVIDAITGLVRNQEGTIRVDGVPIERLSAHRRSAYGLSRSFQSVELFDSLSVVDNLQVASQRNTFFSYVRDTVAPRKSALTATAAAAIDEFDLGSVIDKLPTELSFGERRLAGIARSIASDASILLLDEPAAGLDDRQCEDLIELIRRLADDWGMSVLLVEHHVPLVERVCDRIVAMNSGAPIASGTPSEVMASPLVHSSYLGAALDLAERTELADDGVAAH